MAGINLSKLNIPKSDEQVKRKHVIRLDELSDAYSNPERIESEEVKKGELKKPIPSLEKLDKKLEKIEKHTQELITKHKAREGKDIAKALSINSPSEVKPSPNRSLKTSNVSYVDFILMKGIKKVVLKHIQENMYDEDNLTYSFIDTDEIKKHTDSDTNIIRDTIYKLKKDGWFEIIQQHYSKRLIKISKENFSK